MKCPKCDGAGKIEKAINHQEKIMLPCDECEGTGEIPETMEEILGQIIKRLDRIIGLLEVLTRK